MSCLICDCLLCIDPCSFLTMSLNKTLQMDPHVSCSDNFVTEYSATQGSSSFSEEHWPGMDTARILLALKQGPRSLENYIQEYLAIAYYSDLPDCLLIEFFCDGINQPLRSMLISEGPRSSLCQFMDYALLCVGSSFTVGVADEERNTALTHVMAAALENEHKMAATAEPDRKMAVTIDFHESSQVTVDLHELSQVTVDRRESSQVTVDRHESGHVSADLHESGHVSADLHESGHVSADLHKSSHVSADLPESLNVSAGLPESLHVSAHHPESRHVSAHHPESHRVTADHPESHRVTAGHPELRHSTADHTESHRVTADHPECCHVLSVTPRYSRSVSAPPWWAPVSSALPWWAPVPSTPPWLPALPALPRSPATPLPRGPGPPSLPLSRLRSTALLDCKGGSSWIGGGCPPWGGGGCYVTNPGHDLPFTHHQRSLAHHIDSCTTLLLHFTIGLQFPSSIALTTHSCHQSHIALITQLIVIRHAT